jgi:hypothetical protein
MRTLLQYIGICAATLIILIGCGDEKTEPQSSNPEATVDSTVDEKVDTVLAPETTRFFDSTGFGEFARKTSNVSWQNFRLVNVTTEDSMLVQPFDKGEAFIRRFGKMFRYSPDSTLILDMDSYNVQLTTNASGKTIATEQGPDTEIALIDLKARTRKRLVFLGPSGSVEEGGWSDADNVVIAGLQEVQDANASVPVIWKYHVPTNTLYLFQSTDTVRNKAAFRAYRKNRLEAVSSR